MKGADEYCEIFKDAEQIGRLYVVPSHHARGNTFRIFVLPKGEAVIENGGINPPLNVDTVEVYGAVSGQPGWTETYGWKHDGPWIRDFVNVYNARNYADKIKREKAIYAEAKQRIKDEEKTQALLSTY